MSLSLFIEFYRVILTAFQQDPQSTPNATEAVQDDVQPCGAEVYQPIVTARVDFIYLPC